MHSRNAQNSYQLRKKVLVKKTDTFLLLFRSCLENNTVAKSKLINIILVQSILHILPCIYCNCVAVILIIAFPFPYPVTILYYNV